METSLVIPIPHYPPFKLRSSLIDKDPVIWVHLLEAYIRLFKFLLSEEENGSKILSIKSQQQLQLFLKVFLYETSQETTQIFSLGAINPDIRENTYQLKVLVFQYVRNFSIVKLNLTGEAVWHFASIYITANPTVVRGLVDGTFKSKYNDNKKSGSISCINLVQKHIQEMVLNNKFSKTDLSNLSLLLGQHTSVTQTISLTTSAVSSTSSGSVSVNTKGSNALAFADNFVNSNWIEILERLYSNGKGISANSSKELMIVSLLSLSVSKIAKLAMDLRITNVKSLPISPLFSSLIISEPFQELIPGLEERLQFLRKITFRGDDVGGAGSGVIENDLPGEDQISFLQEIFPDLTKQKAITILLENDRNVETVTSLLLENPDIVSAIEDYKPPQKQESKQKKKPSQSLIDRFSNVGFEKSAVVANKKTKNVDLSTNNVKEKTLSAALRLMYDSDEDEPDDTYDDQIATVGSAGIDEDKSSSKKGVRLTSKLAVLDDDEDEDTRESSPMPRSGLSAVSTSTGSSGVSPRERYLFSVFKTKSADLFAKTSRKTPDRGAMKKSTDWSDEQIEGWFRMLSKSPKTFKILEEDYFYSGNPNKKQTVLNNKNNTSANANTSNNQNNNNNSSKPKTKEQEKRSQARNEKNKASRANHNRKSGFSKKTKGDLIGLQ